MGLSAGQDHRRPPLLQLQMALPTAPFPAGARAGWQVGSGWRPQRQLFTVPTPGCSVTFSSGIVS